MKYSKLEIGRIQLERALRLFDEQDLISAITLAGAADEIFGKMLEKRDKRAAYTIRSNVTNSIYENIGKRKLESKQINFILNGVRNGLKHFDEEATMEFDDHQEAINMLDRAISNYHRLTSEKTDRMVDFEKRGYLPQWEIPDPIKRPDV